MKKTSTICILFIAAIFARPSFSLAGGMDLMLRQAVRGDGVGTDHSKSISPQDDERSIPCLIKSSDLNSTMEAIVRIGGAASRITDQVISAKIPSSRIEEIVARDEVVTAEAALPLSRKMNTSRASSGVDVVQDGSALGVPYGGKNVVVGIVDDGLDFGNEDFVGANGMTRVQYLMQEGAETQIECTKWSITYGGCDIADGGQGTYHGTHVTGIAAGSSGTYTGAAPQADIMFVFINPSDPDTSGGEANSFASSVIMGVSKIFEKADIIDKAAVVNLSLGTSVGAHDGTSLLESSLTQMTSAKPGRIIVNAAGNEQANPSAFSGSVGPHIGGIHASIAVNSGVSRGSRIMVLNGRGAASTFNGGTLMDLWLDAGQKDSCSVAVFAYSNGRVAQDFTFPGLSSTDSAIFTTGDIPLSSSTTSPVTATGGSVVATVDVDASDSRNGKPHAAILLKPESSANTSALERAWFDVVVRSNGSGVCTGHMWLYFDYAAYHDFLTGVATGAYDVPAGASAAGYALYDGDSLFTTTIPATADGVIAVGSWMPPKPVGSSSSEWTGDDGRTYAQSSLSVPGGTGSTTGDLSVFSSLGPTADGRTKPEIVAPGEPIISTKARDYSASSAITVGGSHIKEAGTSMSSPHVAGIVALLLERNNTLGVDAVRSALIAGAHTDGMISKTPDPANSFGAGKVYAPAVLASVAADTSAYHGQGDLEPMDAGGCSIGAIHMRGNSAPAFPTLAIYLLVISIWRRRHFNEANMVALATPIFTGRDANIPIQ